MAYDYSAAFKQCMIDLDLVVMRKLYGVVLPHLPQPKSDSDALIILHHARTQSPLLEMKLRAYSHRWLLDHGLPSGIPDNLKPKAERLYPSIANAVGISVNSKYPDIREAVRQSMQNAVLEAYADGKTEPVFVKRRMMEARRRITGQIGGRYV